MSSDTEIIKQVQSLAKILLTYKLRVVTAESCTGGGVAEALTAITGSSTWFDCGFVTYSNAAKTNLLGVSSQLIELVGAVSEEVVQAMAKSALNRSNAHLSVAISGIAGPLGGSIDKPVGTVWFAWASNQNLLTTECLLFSGNRSEIRKQATLYAIKGLTILANKTQTI